MTDPNPMMMIMFDNMGFVGESETVEQAVRPTDEQFAFNIGDTALLAMANTPLENDLVVVKMLRASKYADEFPNWEERLLNSYVLCKIFSRADTETSMGWVSRLKLVPITKYRYKQARAWQKDGFPEYLPEWVVRRFEEYTNSLAEQAPDSIPRSVKCPGCGSTDIVLQVARRLVYKGRAGLLTINGVDQYITVSIPEEEDTHVAELYCTDCDSRATLTDDEWALPGITR